MSEGIPNLSMLGGILLFRGDARRRAGGRLAWSYAIAGFLAGVGAVLPPICSHSPQQFRLSCSSSRPCHAGRASWRASEAGRTATQATLCNNAIQDRPA